MIRVDQRIECKALTLGSVKELDELNECNPDACPALHSPPSNAMRSREGKSKGERKGGGSKVETLRR